MRAPRLMLIVALAAWPACSRPPADATPEGAVREFTEHLGLLDGNEADARALFELLSERAQTNLKARAERYGNASGRQVPAWTMVVPARTRMRFTPQSFQAKTVGKYALVDVLGVSSDQVVQIPCVLEKERWRVDLTFPDLPPLPRRTGIASP